MNIHKFKKSLDKEISSKPVDLLLSIFSPVTYYQPKEEIVYIVFALKKPTKALNAILVSPINKDTDNFTEIEEKELNFSEEGIAIVRFSGHPVGEYQAVIAEKYRKEEDDYIAFGSYIYVVEYRQSLLTSEVVNHKTENGKMYIELQVKRPDGSLYTGKLFAMYNNFSSLPIENSDGNFSIIVPEFFYDMKSIERERANIQLSDEYGNCCEIQFNETGSSSKFDIQVFHDYHNMMFFGKSDAQLLGFPYKHSSNERDDKCYHLLTPIIKDYQNEKIKIQVPNKEIKELIVVQFNIIKDQYKVSEFQKVKANQIIELDAYNPVTFLCVYDNEGFSYHYQNAFSIVDNTNLNIHVTHFKEHTFGKPFLLNIFSNEKTEVVVILKQKVVSGTNLKEGFFQVLNYFFTITNTLLTFKMKDALDKVNNSKIKKFWNYIIEKVDKNFAGFIKFISLTPLVLIYLFVHSLNFLKYPTYIKEFLYFLRNGEWNFIARRRRLREEELASQQYMMREAALRVMEEDSTNMEISTEEDPTARTENRSVLYAEMFTVDQQKTVEINSITDIGEIEIQVLAKKGIYHSYHSSSVLVSTENYVIQDIPPLLSVNSKVNTALFWVKSKLASWFKLNNEKGKEILKTTCKDEDKISVQLESVGVYQSELSDNKKVLDRFQKQTYPLYKDTVLKTNFHLLKPGESIKGKSLKLYSHPAGIILSMVDSLFQYPYGCTEQTLAGAFGNAILYLNMDRLNPYLEKKLSKKQLFSRIESAKTHIKNKLHAVPCYNNFLWGLYDNTKGNIPISKQCLLHLRPFLDKKFSDFGTFHSWINDTKETLIKQNVVDNRLLCFSEKFLEPDISSPESAAALILYDKISKQAISYLETSCQHDRGGVYWKGKSMAGKLQTTVFVMRALKKVEHPLFYEAWKYISSQFTNERLYSTADTAELLSLLLESQIFSQEVICTINGKKQSIQSNQTILEETEITSDNSYLLIREDFFQEVDYLQTENTVPFTIETTLEVVPNFSKKKILLKLSDKEEGSYVARVLLAGGVGFTNGNIKTQKKDFPFYGNQLEFEINAYRTGDAELFVYLFDMYDAERQSTSGRIEFKVV